MTRIEAIIEILSSEYINDQNHAIYSIDSDLSDQLEEYEPLDILLMGKDSEKIDESDQYFGFPNGNFRTFSEEEVVEFFDHVLKSELDRDYYQSLCDNVKYLQNEN